MPKILTLGTNDTQQAAAHLNQVKVGHQLDLDGLRFLKHTINNSTVGLSKLLHFVNPNLYAIWDSHVARYLVKKQCPQNWMNDLTFYTEYINLCHAVTEWLDYTGVHDLIVQKVGYSMTHLRTLELLMFWHARERKRVKNAA